MATIVDSLLITLGLDSSDLEKSLSGVEQSIAGWVKGIVTDVLDPLVGSSAFSALLSDVTDAVSTLGKTWDNAFHAMGGNTTALLTPLGQDNEAAGLSWAGSNIVEGLPYEGVAPGWQDTETAKKFGAAAPQESLTVLSALIGGGVPAVTLFDQTLAGLTKTLDGFFARLKNGTPVLSSLWNAFETGKERSEVLSNAWAELKKAGEALWSGQKGEDPTFSFSFEEDVQPFNNPQDTPGNGIQATSYGASNQVADTPAGSKVSDASTGVFKTLSTTVSGILSSIGGFFTGGFHSPEGENGTAASESTEVKAPQQQKASATNGSSFSENGFWAGIKNSLSSVGESIKAFDNQVRSCIGAFVIQSVNPDASQGLSTALAAGAAHNSTETTVNVGGIVVNAQSNDAVGIARETGEEIRRMVATANKGVRQ